MRLFDVLSGPPLPTLRGEGVLLRLPHRRDYAEWRALRHASRAFLSPWEPTWTSDELSRQAFSLRLLRYRRDARDRAGYSFFLFDGGGRTLLGGVTIGLIRRGVSQSCTLGYWMG